MKIDMQPSNDGFHLSALGNRGTVLHIVRVEVHPNKTYTARYLTEGRRQGLRARAWHRAPKWLKAAVRDATGVGGNPKL